MSIIPAICRQAREASFVLQNSAEVEKNALLRDLAVRLRVAGETIIAENRTDVDAARESGLAAAVIDRLVLTEDRIEKMAVSVEEIAALPDPVGEIRQLKRRPSGIQVGQMRVPLGVVGVIYESRPNVTTDIAALCLKSGNAAILRGGSESIHSNRALASVITDTLHDSPLPAASVQLVEDTDRSLVTELLRQDDTIDVIVPRGGRPLIDFVSRESSIPVIKHDMGVCHTFVDRSADRQMARSIAVNAKVQRPGVCNAMETLLIHEEYPYTAELLRALLDEGVELRGCERACNLSPQVKPAVEEDWGTEYLALILAVKIVASQEEAVAHIRRYGSDHSEAIVTSDYRSSRCFLRQVNSSSVMVNASTRFADGGEYGLGAEVGISTQKLHVRGPMGVRDLTCEKYLVYGDGHIRGS